MTESAQRRARLAEVLAQHNLDALLVTSLPNVRYLTGFTGSSGIVVVAPDKATLFTDPRYDVQARREVDCAVNIARRPTKELHAKLAKSRYSRLGFEATALTVGEFNALTAAIGSSKPLLPTSGLIETLRMVKSATELDIIRKAVQVNSDSFTAAMSQVREGMSESDLAAEIDHQMRLRGAESPAFETIVAFGPNSALPHARPGARKLTSGELLLIDMGAQVGGYSSDMTRMAYFGTPGRKIKTLHKTLLAAQIAGVNAVKHGVKAGVVDAATRGLLRRHDLNARFTHSTGHGLGLEIHEAPRLGKSEKTVLQSGMTVTVEPGIYFEDELGMRIEDTVLVTAGGCEVLTPTPKELLVI